MNISVSEGAAVVGRALLRAEGGLRASGVERPAVVAGWLLSHMTGVPRLTLQADPARVLSPEEVARFNAAVTRAGAHEPLQYIVGDTSFMGHPIRCDARALIPRPETEMLVDLVLKDAWLRERICPTVIDVGTGTGCIVLSLALDFGMDASFVGVDVSEEALSLARENAAALGVSDRVQLQQGDLLAGWAPETADAVIANLPYIASDDVRALPPNVRDHEPVSALDGGPDGLCLVQRLIEQASVVLRLGGVLYLEIGADQADAVAATMRGHNFEQVTVQRDGSGRDRMVRGIRV